MKLLLPLPFLALLVAALAWSPVQDEGARVVTARMWHLGDNATPEWPEAPEEPEGGRIELSFEGRAFEGEGTLFVRQLC